MAKALTIATALLLTATAVAMAQPPLGTYRFTVDQRAAGDPVRNVSCGLVPLDHTFDVRVADGRMYLYMNGTTQQSSTAFGRAKDDGVWAQWQFDSGEVEVVHLWQSADGSFNGRVERATAVTCSDAWRYAEVFKIQ